MAEFTASRERKEKLDKFVDTLRDFEKMTKDVMSMTLDEMRRLEGDSTERGPEFGSKRSGERRNEEGGSRQNESTLTGLRRRSFEKKEDVSLAFEPFGDPPVDAMISMSALNEGSSAVSSSDANSIAKYVSNSSNLSVLKIFEVGRNKAAGGGGGGGARSKMPSRTHNTYLWAPASHSNLKIFSGASKTSSGHSSSSPLQLFDRANPAIPHLRLKGAPSVLLLCLANYDQAYKSPKGFTHWMSNDPQKGFDCVIGTGSLIPEYKESGSLRGYDIPYGKTVKNTQFQSYSLTFSEYIFHNPKQVELQFLVVVK